MSNLHNLKPANGSTKNRTRVGRGPGSGKGGTSTRGHKGAKSRSGYRSKTGFEGGQMPLFRRIPKYGFKNPFRVEYSVINLDRLQEFADKHKDKAKDAITPDNMKAYGLIGTNGQPVKILGRGELKAKLNITAHKFSKAAKEAIEKAGGSVTELGA